MNRVGTASTARIITALVEGCSLRSTSRMTVVAINTVVKLAVDAGAACSEYQDRVMRNLKCQRLQVDEIWSFCYAKAKNVTPEIAAKNPHAGDTWKFTGIDADSKLIPCWMIGPRDAVTARMFINDLAERRTERVQLTTDGLSVYVKAVERAAAAWFSIFLENAFVRRVKRLMPTLIATPVLRLVERLARST